MRITLLTLFLFMLVACRSGDTIRSEVQRDAAKAYARMQEPYVLAGEDVELLCQAFNSHLTKLGDRRFSAALTALPSDHIAAVRYFLNIEKLASDYPKTRAVLAHTPEAIFPAALKTEENAKLR